tara:strand:- start:3963 stop:5027 length:1065 start_codon:yes stop_codon:yes gene_type:complete
MLGPSKSTITGRKIRFAVVGCGRISARHFEAIDANSDDAELVAVCDVDKNKLETICEQLKVKGFDNLNDMLGQTQCDCVVLCTPSGLHSNQTIEIVQNGYHVITEKPMATRLSDGRDMVKAADEAGKKLFVVKQNRLNPTLKILKDALVKRRFGRLYMANLNVFWTRPQDYYDSAPWRGTWEFDGGALMNQASHYIDLLDWLIGPIESVHSYTATLARNIEVEDTATVNVKWRNGALGSINVTMLTYPKNYEGSVTILGEKGTVEIGGLALNEVKHWEFETPWDVDRTISEASYKTDSVYGIGHPLYYRNVIDVMRGANVPSTDGREGLRSLETLTAIYSSAKNGCRVSLPLDY